MSSESLISVASAQKQTTKVSLDTIVNTVADYNVVAAVDELINTKNFSDFQLGGYLHRVRKDKLWLQESKTFKEFLHSRGIPDGKAFYLIRIYNTLQELDIPAERVEHLGWTKMRVMVPILNASNYEEWLARAEDMKVVELSEAVKAAKSGSSSEDIDKEEKISSVVFHLHPDQQSTVMVAIDKAKKEAGTEYNSVALEAVCLNYISGQTVGAITEDNLEESLVDLFKLIGPEEVAQAVDLAFPSIDFTLAL